MEPYLGSGAHTSTAHSRVSLNLEHLGLVPVNVPGHFTIKVAGGDDAELAVSVQGKNYFFPWLFFFLVLIFFNRQFFNGVAYFELLSHC